MTKIQRYGWGPDTCNCYIFKFLDADLPVDKRVEWSEEVAPYMANGELHKGTTRCEIHKEYTDANEHYTAILEENQRKNRAHLHINKCEIPIEWEWDSDRVLHITKYDINTDTKAKSKKDLQQIIDKELTKNSHGKVVLN